MENTLFAWIFIMNNTWENMTYYILSDWAFLLKMEKLSKSKRLMFYFNYSKYNGIYLEMDSFPMHKPTTEKHIYNAKIIFREQLTVIDEAWMQQLDYLAQLSSNG